MCDAWVYINIHEVPMWKFLSTQSSLDEGECDTSARISDLLRTDPHWSWFLFIFIPRSNILFSSHPILSLSQPEIKLSENTKWNIAFLRLLISCSISGAEQQCSDQSHIDPLRDQLIR